jgi:hypothetical protein
MRTRWWQGLVIAALCAGVLARLNYLRWDDPWGPHHPDETSLALEAIALWEGITPREVGWPASTTRLALSAVAAVDWTMHRAGGVSQVRGQPDRALAEVSQWIAEQYVDQSRLYRLGRATALALGLLQLLAGVWALRRWTDWPGTAAGSLMLALSPLPVAFSQYVLCDMTGVLFVTVMVGLAAAPTTRSILWMAVLAGLAASSKFHFGLWLLTPLVAVWLMPAVSVTGRLRLTSAAIGLFACVVVLFVPWFWINPVLGLKEFAGVVLFKVAGPETGGVLTRLHVLLGGLSPIEWIGLLLGLAAMGRVGPRRLAAIFGPVTLGAAALVASAIVFDRYVLVLLPGIVLMASQGWAWLIGHPRARVRTAGAIALTVAVGWTAVALWHAQRVAGETDVDALATRWIEQHVPRGSRVAVHDESASPLPRAAGQLRECEERVNTPEAYARKWRTLGIEPTTSDQPMASALLTDELFYAYWCRQERQAQTDPGFHVVPYHREPRFWAELEADVIEEFRTGASTMTGGIDVLILNRRLDDGLEPAHVIQTSRGLRAVYLRHAPNR